MPIPFTTGVTAGRSEYDNWRMNSRLLHRYTINDVEDQLDKFYLMFNNTKEALEQRDLLAKINREHDAIMNWTWFNARPGESWDTAATSMKQSFKDYAKLIHEFYEDMIDFISYDENKEAEYADYYGELARVQEDVMVVVDRMLSRP